MNIKKAFLTLMVMPAVLLTIFPVTHAVTSKNAVKPKTATSIDENTKPGNDWSFLFEQGNSKFYYDADSREKLGNKVTFWLKVTVENPLEITLEPMEVVHMRQIMDCENKELSEPIAWENRDGSGKLVESGQRPKDTANWVNIAELEGGEEMRELVCKF